MAAEPGSVPVIDATARCNAGMSGEEFVRKVQSGEIVNDDRVSGITFLFMLLDGLPEARGCV